MALVNSNCDFPDLLDEPAGPAATSSGPPRVIDFYGTGTQGSDEEPHDDDEDEDDDLLDELLDDDTLAEAPLKRVSAYKTDHSDGTSQTTGSDFSPQEATSIGMDEFERFEKDDDEYEDDGDDEEEEESCDSDDESSFRSYISDKTADILEKAHDRIALQKLKEDMLGMEEVVDKKNDEIELLAGQLRRAVATKCDLIISHTELEHHHDSNLKMRESDVWMLQKANYGLLEVRAKVEQEFMNELVLVTEAMKEEQKKHHQEMDDWERMHKNEMLEKDFQIAQLTEELRKVKAASGQSVRETGGKKKSFGGLF